MTYRISENVVSRCVDGETFAYHRKSGILFSFTESGALVWRLIEERQDAGNILCRLAETYEAQQETIREDLAAFMEELVKSKLVITNDPE